MKYFVPIIGLVLIACYGAAYLGAWMDVVPTDVNTFDLGTMLALLALPITSLVLLATDGPSKPRNP